MRDTLRLLFAVALLALKPVVQAEDLPKLNEALPLHANISSIYPVFDFDGDSCYPSAAISRSGKQNAGLKPTGRVTGLCRNDKFLQVSNTYHRYACVKKESTEYCGHSFALYMLKDQKHVLFGGGHKHEFVYVILWTKNGTTGLVTYSDSKFKTIDVGDVPRQNGHPMFVYHKRILSEHWLRPAGRSEDAENSYGVFVTPTIVSWYTMEGDKVSNKQLREMFSSYDYGGDARLMHVDGHFLTIFNLFKPTDFPEFPPDSGDYSQ